MFSLHFFAGWRLLVVFSDRLIFIWETKKVVAGRVKQVVVLYSNNFTGIRLGGLSIGRLRQVVGLLRWSPEHVWL